MQALSKSQLREWINTGEDMLLVDVLSKESFKKQHIPGSVSIPLQDNPHFVQDVEAAATSRNQRIVVYCASTQCDASRKAAQQLEEAGFTNVQAYEEGVEGWFGSKAAA